jgi:hypothetical protein
MEDILHLYTLPYNPKRPVVCFDEVPYCVVADNLEPHPMRPGIPAKVDYTYRRLGVWNLLVAFHPALGQRRLELHKRRTAQDYTAFMLHLAALLPDADKIVLIQDNLNTHTPASFYKCLSPDQAFALAQKFEFHFTPKHASWLNMVEIELSVILRSCLNTRFPSFDHFATALLDFVRFRNRTNASVRWQFSPSIARTSLKRLYDSISF